MLSVSISLEQCPDCGGEWPIRFGRHNCNFHRVYVHNKAVVVEPGTDLVESVGRLAGRQEEDAKRSAEYADLGGYEPPYPEIIKDIDATIGLLKRHRLAIQQLAKHVHDWNGGDYCSICGADGRA